MYKQTGMALDLGIAVRRSTRGTTIYSRNCLIGSGDTKRLLSFSWKRS